MNREEFMQWLEEIDPDIDFDDLGYAQMMVCPDFASAYLDRDAIITVDSPEAFQFLALYMEEFLCGWTYKNTTIWREGDVWGADHQWIVNGLPQVYHISLFDFNNDAEMVDFIIMLNDGKLPETAPDDSPIHPPTFLRGGKFDSSLIVDFDEFSPDWQKFSDYIKLTLKNNSYGATTEEIEAVFEREETKIREWFDIELADNNPFIVAMNTVNADYRDDLSPLTFNTVDDWLDATEWDDDFEEIYNPYGYDVDYAREVAYPAVEKWFYEVWRDATHEEIEGAINWLLEAGDEDEELISKLEAKLGDKNMTELEREQLGGDESTSDDNAKGE